MDGAIMAGEVNVNTSGSWLGDLSKEWKTAKTPEKVFMVGAVIGVIAIALYLHKQSSSPSQPGASGSTGLPANFQQGSGGGGSGSTGGSSGSVGTPGAPGAPGAPGKPGAPYKPPVQVPHPIIHNQPTQLARTYGNTSHAVTNSYKSSPPPNYKAPVAKAKVPVVPYKAWTPPNTRIWGYNNFVVPSHTSAPRPGPSGGRGTPPPQPAGGKTNTYGKLLSLNG